jgi:hypothetical protein
LIHQIEGTNYSKEDRPSRMFVCSQVVGEAPKPRLSLSE